MKSLMIPSAVALAIALASCGGANSKSNSKQTSSTTQAAKVLVDATGMALYTPDGESAANIRCTGSCTSIWKPVPPSAVPSATGKIGVTTRPDGSKQATVAGKPLYTFAQDSPGAVTGNGVSDAFGGQRFTWHAVKPGGAATTASAPSGGGYGGY